ncbi:hypothetical protein ACF0H5_006953 [Mactra antiquata]
MMEQFEELANEWLMREQNELDCAIETKNGELHFTVNAGTSGSEENINFSINIDSETNNLNVWSEHLSIQPQLGSILDFCASLKPENIELLLEKVFKVINDSLKKKSSKDYDDDDDDNDDDDNEEDDAYYGYSETEDDAVEKPKEKEVKSRDRNVVTSDSDESDEESASFYGGKANAAACHRLMKDLKSMKKEAHKFCIEGTPRGNNLFVWDVKLTDFPSDTRLGKDILAWAEKSKREPVVYLEMQFPGDYPMKPPFVRVIRPRFKFLTGHVTIGGSICMEMLTSTGWTPTNDIEGILVQIRSEIMSDPNTRLDSNPDKAYNETEARNAFERMVQRYGWQK